MLRKKTLLKNIGIIIILALTAILRLLWIDKIPNAIGGDELIYVLTSKSIALTGTDLTGSWNPLSVFLFNYPSGQMQAELPYFILLPILKFAPLSLLSVRLIYSIMSIFTVLLIYLISKHLFNKNIAIFTAFIASINPWFIYIGRTSYEMVPATLFFLCGLYLLLLSGSKKIFLGFLFFVLAFYSYIGTKLIFLPFILLSVLYSFYFLAKKKYLRSYLIILFLSLILVLSFVFAVKNNANSRMGEIISINDPVISNRVDYIRKNSIQSPITNILVNKPTVFVGIITEKFVTTLSFDYLFAKGDEFFSNMRHGLFYYLDFVFLILGIGFTFAKYRKLAFFLLGMIAVSIMPHVLHGTRLDNFTPHITLLFPFFIFFIGIGIWETGSLFKAKKYNIMALGIIVILYLISLLNFLNTYFYQFPLGGFFNFPVRQISKYIDLNSGHKTIVYSPRSYDLFTKYLFYANKLNVNTIQEVSKDIRHKKYVLGNVEFISCNTMLDFSKVKATIIYDFDCGSHPGKVKHKAISRLSDGGQVYEIYNDTVCKKYNLKGYPLGVSINDFSIENLSAKNFCEIFVSSL